MFSEVFDVQRRQHSLYLARSQLPASRVSARALWPLDRLEQSHGGFREAFGIGRVRELVPHIAPTGVRMNAAGRDKLPANRLELNTFESAAIGQRISDLKVSRL